MPQMAPTWWTFIMMLTVMSMTMMNSTMYFYLNKKMTKKTTMSTKNKTWKL
uniref:ATP synthase F0 subunit 8 n=1 Tax=Xestocephalus gracilus TaxID=3112137 RepID=UPI002E76F482|nr:ATP synthase F0 subunit 8 [Xestocephalus gracilus]WRK21300.1 ATP synthase F0 subunit 8 [Xestocephalus gracilus]